MSSKRPKVPREVAGVTHMTASPGPTVVEAGGRVWRLGFNDQDAKARLEELIRGHVIRDALATKRAVGGPDGEAHYRDAASRVEGGEYLTFAPGWARLMGQPAGSLLFLLSLLQEHHPDATADDVRRLSVAEPEQCEAAVRAVAPDFFAAAALQMGLAPGAAAGLAAEMAAAIGGAAPATGSTS